MATPTRRIFAGRKASTNIKKRDLLANNRTSMPTNEFLSSCYRFASRGQILLVENKLYMAYGCEYRKLLFRVEAGMRKLRIMWSRALSNGNSTSIIVPVHGDVTYMKNW